MKKILLNVSLVVISLGITNNTYAIDFGKFISNIFLTKAGGKAVENYEGKDVEKFKKSNCNGLNLWGLPLISDDKVLEHSLYFCRDMYSVHYDSVYKTPLVVSEVLTKNNLLNPHPEKLNYPPVTIDPNIPEGMQVDLKDYAGTGYEPFLLAPLADMFSYNDKTKDALLFQQNQHSIDEAVYTTNTLPMVTSLKTGLWKQLEIQIRSSLINPISEELYVVTGPIYLNGKVKGSIGKKGVAIPTHYYKIIANPHTDGSLTYIIPNENIFTIGKTKTKNMYICNGGSCDLTNFIAPLKEVEKLTGIVFFPKLSPEYAKKVKLDLNELYKKPK